ncbi:hypothetical protein C5167_005612, partial [Papaver somniferum]
LGLLLNNNFVVVGGGIGFVHPFRGVNQEAKASGSHNYERELEDVIDRRIVECDRKITRPLKRLGEDDSKAAIVISMSEVTQEFVQCFLSINLSMFMSRSPYRSRSPVYRRHRSLSRDCEIQTNGVGSKTNRDDYPSQRIRGRRSPVRHTPEREEVKFPDQKHKALYPVGVRTTFEESDFWGWQESTESPLRGTREQRNCAESASPVRQIRDHGARLRGSPETSGDENVIRARRHARLSPRKRTSLVTYGVPCFTTTTNVSG